MKSSLKQQIAEIIMQEHGKYPHDPVKAINKAADRILKLLERKI